VKKDPTNRLKKKVELSEEIGSSGIQRATPRGGGGTNCLPEREKSVAGKIDMNYPRRGGGVSQDWLCIRRGGRVMAQGGKAV